MKGDYKGIHAFMTEKNKANFVGKKIAASTFISKAYGNNLLNG